MKKRKLTGLYFSPSGHTKRYIEAMAEVFAGEKTLVDLTPAPEREISRSFNSDDFVIAAMPVYGGRLPLPAEDLLGGVTGNNTPAVALVTYGNRAYEDALLELCDALEQRGFVVMGAAALVAQHSTAPGLAVGRPNGEDLDGARDFFLQAVSKGEPTHLSVPGNRPYKEGMPPSVYAPVLTEKCVECGLCAGVCPTEAISPKDASQVDVARCLHCTACISCCPSNARKMTDPRWEQTRAYLTEHFSKVCRENEFYL